MKICPNCGAQMDNNAMFCTSCGTPWTPPQLCPEPGQGGYQNQGGYAYGAGYAMPKQFPICRVSCQTGIEDYCGVDPDRIGVSCTGLDSCHSYCGYCLYRRTVSDQDYLLLQNMQR